MGERKVRNLEVRGSIPLWSTKETVIPSGVAVSLFDWGSNGSGSELSAGGTQEPRPGLPRTAGRSPVVTDITPAALGFDLVFLLFLFFRKISLAFIGIVPEFIEGYVELHLKPVIPVYMD